MVSYKFTEENFKEGGHWLASQRKQTNYYLESSDVMTEGDWEVAFKERRLISGRSG